MFKYLSTCDLIIKVTKNIKIKPIMIKIVTNKLSQDMEKKHPVQNSIINSMLMKIRR